MNRLNPEYEHEPSGVALQGERESETSLSGHHVMSPIYGVISSPRTPFDQHVTETRDHHLLVLPRVIHNFTAYW